MVQLARSARSSGSGSRTAARLAGSSRWRRAHARHTLAALGRSPRGHRPTARPERRGVVPRLGRGHDPVHGVLVLAGVLLTCYVAALALLLGASVSTRRAPRTPRSG